MNDQMPMYLVEDTRGVTYYTFAHTRFDAYANTSYTKGRVEVLDRVCEYVEINAQAVATMPDKKLFYRTCFNLIEIKGTVQAVRPALFDNRIELVPVDDRYKQIGKVIVSTHRLSILSGGKEMPIPSEAIWMLERLGLITLKK